MMERWTEIRLIWCWEKDGPVLSRLFVSRRRDTLIGPRRLTHPRTHHRLKFIRVESLLNGSGIVSFQLERTDGSKVDASHTEPNMRGLVQPLIELGIYSSFKMDDIGIGHLSFNAHEKEPFSSVAMASVVEFLKVGGAIGYFGAPDVSEVTNVRYGDRWVRFGEYLARHSGLACAIHFD